MQKIALSIDISQEIPLRDNGQAVIAAWVIVPEHAFGTPLATLLCLPGGSYTSDYFDFPYGDEADYSFARYMAARGILVIGLDHLGIGKSSRPHGAQLTTELLAKANHTAMKSIVSGLEAGTLSPELPPLRIGSLIGVGHSMGGYLTIQQQARWPMHQGLILQGWSNYELQADELFRKWAENFSIEASDTKTAYEILGALYQDGVDGYINFYRPAARGIFYFPDVPQDLIDLDSALATTIPAPILRDLANIPAIQESARAIKVPIFLTFGEPIDVSPDPRREPQLYTNSLDVTLYRLGRSSHCHNFASTRHELWQRLASWVHTLHLRHLEDQDKERQKKVA